MEHLSSVADLVLCQNQGYHLSKLAHGCHTFRCLPIPIQSTKVTICHPLKALYQDRYKGCVLLLSETFEINRTT